MSQPTLQELLSPQLLTTVRDYSLMARIAVEGWLAGLHRSSFQGNGSEFVQYRSYTRGDDLKLLDWKLLARSNRMCTKVYEEETNMPCAILLDGSSSMNYQGTGAVCSKFRYGCILSACLAHLCMLQTDRAGLFIYSDRLLAGTAPGHGAGSLRQIFAMLEAASPEGTAGSPLAFQQIGTFLKRKGMVFLITDGYNQEETLDSFLQQMQYTGHDCVICQILDPDELQFPFQQTVRFQDSETAGNITVTGRLARQNYLEHMARFREDIRQICRRHHADYLFLETTRSLEIPLTAWLNHREGKHR